LLPIGQRERGNVNAGAGGQEPARLERLK